MDFYRARVTARVGERLRKALYVEDAVSRAGFVTAGAIDLKLCTYVPLGEMTVQTKFRSDLILGLATRGQKPKTKSAMTPELMAGSSPNCYHMYI
jgi:hypothetical protein